MNSCKNGIQLHFYNFLQKWNLTAFLHIFAKMEPDDQEGNFAIRQRIFNAV